MGCLMDITVSGDIRDELKKQGKVDSYNDLNRKRRICRTCQKM